MPSKKKLRGKARIAKKSAIVPLSPAAALELPKIGDSGWGGPGGHYSARYEQRDMKLFQKGVERLPCTNNLVSDAEFRDVGGGAIVAVFERRGDSRSPVPAADISNDIIHAVNTSVCLLRPRWQALYMIYGEASGASEVLSRVPGDLGQAIMPYYDDKHEVIVISNMQRAAYFRRAKVSYKEGDYQGCVSDTTELIACYMAWASVDGHRTPYNLLAEALFDRAKVLALLGDYCSAHTDLRASCAGFRLRRMEDQSHELIKNLEAKVSTLLYVMGKAKLEEKAPRPFFTDEEQFRVQRELGIGLFSKDSYHCSSCEAVGTDSLKLYLCKCKRHFFCGQRCQREAWVEWHRDDCGSPQDKNTPIKKRIESIIRENETKGRGCAVLYSPIGPAAFLRDAGGEHTTYFNMLCDENAVFY